MMSDTASVMWEETTIGDLIARDGGSIQTGPFGTKLKAAEYTPEGVPVISVGEVGYGQLRVRDETPRVNAAITARMPEYVLRAGDVVFGRKGAVDRCALVRPDQDGWFLGSDGIRLRLPPTTDAAFLAYWLQRPSHRVWMLQHAAGSTMPSLNEDIVRRIPIALPPLDVQRSISWVLRSPDDKIEHNRRTSRALEGLARAMFKAWFVDFEPVHAKAAGATSFPGMPPEAFAALPTRFTHSPLGLVPEGWEARPIREYFKLEKGLSYRGAFLAESGGLPMVNLGCFLGNGRFAVDKLKHYTGDHKPKHIVEAGTLVLANTDVTQSRTVLGSPAIVEDWAGTGRYLFTHHVFAARPVDHDAPAWTTFLYYSLTQAAFRERAEGFATGTTVLGLPRDAVEACTFAFPPESLRDAFRAIVDPMHALMTALREENAKLVELRDYLLPKLLSGEVQVDPTQREAVACP